MFSEQEIPGVNDMKKSKLEIITRRIITNLSMLRLSHGKIKSKI